MTETEQLAFLVREWPWAALEYYSDKLTPEQFDCCVRECPWTALVYYSYKLTKEQLDYCKENTK